MITQEHLEHWISEIRYQLTGAVSELNRTVGITKGIALENNAFVSFEYLIEKVERAYQLLHTIEDDIKND